MKKSKKRMVTMFLIGLIGVVLVVFICNILIISYSRPRVFNDFTDIPYNKVGLLLGTTPSLKNGWPNYYFVNRIEAASELYKAGKIKYILVSGDNHRTDYNEPEEMKQALIKTGVPENVIFLDYAGFRTLDSVVRAKEIFGQDSFTIISQKFHNQRAVFLAARYGLDTIGYNAHDVRLSKGLRVQVREVFARVKVFVDFLVNKKPKFLGEKIELP